MWALYLDESGDVERHSIPLKQGQTPVFTVGGVALPLERWRDYDREFLYLKRQFFAKEIDSSSKSDTRWEIKGSNLIAPRNATSERNKVFTYKVFDLIGKFGGKIFGVNNLKCPNKPTPKSAIYTKSVQIIDERYDIFLREANARGIIILDSRMAHMKKGSGLDYTVAISHLSYVFGNEQGRELKRIKEAPLFADSCLTAGLQIADIVAAVQYATVYREKLAPEGAKQDFKYVDYTHTRALFNPLRDNEFHSSNKYGDRTTHGIRTIDRRTGSVTGADVLRLKDHFKSAGE